MLKTVSCLVSPIAFYREMNQVNGVKAEDVHHLDFSKTFDTVSNCYWQVLTACAHLFQAALFSGRCPTLVPLLPTHHAVRLKPAGWAKSSLPLVRPQQEH